MNNHCETVEPENLDLMQIFAHTDALLRRFHHWKYSQQGTAGNPHRGQGKILRVLKKHPGMTQSELVEMLGIRQQSLGELLAKLEKSGYITREPAADRRIMTIRLTHEGMEAVPKRADPDEIFGCLKEDERERFRNYLLRVAEHMRQTIGEVPDDCYCGKHFRGHHRHGGESFAEQENENGGQSF